MRNRLQIDEDKISLVKDYDQTGETIALLDVPRNQVELDEALEKNYQQIYLRFFCLINYQSSKFQLKVILEMF